MIPFHCVAACNNVKRIHQQKQRQNSKARDREEKFQPVILLRNFFIHNGGQEEDERESFLSYDDRRFSCCEIKVENFLLFFLLP